MVNSNQMVQEMDDDQFIGVTDNVSLGKAIPLSFQHLFAMFGSSVLVPIVFNIDPAIVLFFNGIGTLLFGILTKKKIPAFLGSSFAFLAPVQMLMASGFNFAQIQSGFVVSGLVFAGIAVIVAYTGVDWINKVFPPAAMCSIVTIIGLELAPTAADMAGFAVGANTKVFDSTAVTVSMITLGTVVIGSVVFRGFMKIIPILIGIIVGYCVSIPMGLVNFQAVIDAPFFTLPHMQMAQFNLNCILAILPATLVVIPEHIGHIAVTSDIVGQDLARDPGLKRSLLGDGLSTALSGVFGSVPTTTYGENIGVMALTKVYSSKVIMGAGALSVLLGFSGKLAALIKTIPNPVIGGVSLLLFGSIATSGIRSFIENKVDYSKSRNLILTSVVLIIGLSGITIDIPYAGKVVCSLKGMGLASVVAIVMSLLFIVFDKLNIMNEK